MAVTVELTAALRDLLRAVDVVAGHRATDEICQILDDHPVVLENLKDHEARERMHSNALQHSLDAYNDNRDKMLAEHKEVQTMNSELKKSNVHLQETIERQKASCDKLAQEVQIRAETAQKNIAALKDHERQVHGLIQARKADKTERDSLRARLHQCEATEKDLRIRIEELSGAHEAAEKRAAYNAQALNDVQSLSAQLTQEYPM